MKRVVSSPYVRCVQTVEPLAEAAGLRVELDERLAEGADVDAAFDLLLELDAVHGVVCTHGDLIPLLLRRLVVHGHGGRRAPARPEGLGVDHPLQERRAHQGPLHPTRRLTRRSVAAA